eukprot:6470116-Alexandrium_andersonii.AAC.1
MRPCLRTPPTYCAMRRPGLSSTSARALGPAHKQALGLPLAAQARKLNNPTPRLTEPLLAT